jgi:hypothetical protein
MVNRTINLLLGILLLLAGGLVLAQNLGFIPEFTDNIWILVFAGLSVLFFGAYFASGLKNWPWLFPACILGGLALTVALAESGLENAMVAAPLMLGCALPFLGAYLVDRKRNWWALIPGWVLLVISLLLALVDSVPGELVAALILLSIAVPFLVIFGLDRTKKWALIPAFVLAAVGFIPLLASAVPGEFIGAYVMFMISLPFFLLFFSSPDNWWALLPAGATASVGLLILLVGVDWPNMEDTILVGVMFLGLAATFWVLWLRRRSSGTDWARYPAIGLAIFGILMIVLGGGMGYFWPVLLILGGVALLFMGIRSRKAE